MIATRAQRWRDRRESYVGSAETIRPADYAVEAIDERAAKAFVTRHHYSGTFPAARLSVGLFRGVQLVGVAVFSVPMNNRVVTKHAGVAPAAGVDLGRFVLLDDVPANGETWFLSRAFRVLRRDKPAVIAVTSYADPKPRITAAGLIKPGHVGMIYQGMSAAYRGRALPRSEHLLPGGRPVSERGLSKVRGLEVGHGYVVDDLVSAGAPRPGQDLTEWLDGLYASGFLTRRRHPGNHVYAFPLTRAARLAERDLPRLPYPKVTA